MSALKLTEKLAKEHDLPDAFVRQFILSVLSEIETIALETGRCQIRGFGTFKLQRFAERRMHDYASKKIVVLPARTKLVFEHGRDRIALFQNIGEVIEHSTQGASDANIVIHKNVDN